MPDEKSSQVNTDNNIDNLLSISKCRPIDNLIWQVNIAKADIGDTADAVTLYREATSTLAQH